MLDERKLAALRELLDPEIVAAWLDEVEAHRTRRDQPTIMQTIEQPEPQPVDTRLLNVREVAARLGVGRATVYRMVHRNEIPHVIAGSRIRFGSAVVDRWIAGGGIPSQKD